MIKTRFGGHRLSLLVREGTLDQHLVGMILSRKSVYALPNVVSPKIIFDVGANIGIAAAYFAIVYPDAQIVCFEPLPDNVELLRHNTSFAHDRIRVIPKGLSDRSGSLIYQMSADTRSFGGGTFCGIGGDPDRALSLPVCTVPEALAELKLSHVDAVKIDAEGSEWAVLRSIPKDVRARTQAFVGELHGLHDWRCCRLLERTHAVGVDKRYDRTCYPFIAVRKDLV